MSIASKAKGKGPIVEPAPLGHFLRGSKPERAFLVYLGSQWVCGVGVVKNNRHFARSGFDVLDHDTSGCHSSQTSPTNGEATTLNRPRPRDAASPRRSPDSGRCCFFLNGRLAANPLLWLLFRQPNTWLRGDFLNGITCCRS
jgi:hypothetical protein